MIWGEDQEIKVLEEQNKLCSAMYDNEKSCQVEMTKDMKKEIAEAASLQVSDVDDVLEKYKQLADFHKWLCDRRDSNLPMPESRDELMHIYRMERPKFLFQKDERRKKYSTRQMRW